MSLSVGVDIGTVQSANLPIRNLYVDGTGRDMTADLEIFLEPARAYRRITPHRWRYPPWLR